MAITLLNKIRKLSSSGKEIINISKLAASQVILLAAFLWINHNANSR